jgi:hypothetical protein
MSVLCSACHVVMSMVWYLVTRLWYLWSDPCYHVTISMVRYLLIMLFVCAWSDIWLPDCDICGLIPCYHVTISMVRYLVTMLLACSWSDIWWPGCDICGLIPYCHVHDLIPCYHGLASGYHVVMSKVQYLITMLYLWSDTLLPSPWSDWYLIIMLSWRCFVTCIHGVVYKCLMSVVISIMQF